ncbi:MAG: MgtC/SapB family protein [Acidobacteriota bacterium]|nr:MgtC/SapB family protein [Acidobacteriota bacterium]
MGHLAAYLYSLAIGLLVGLERERSYRGRSGQAYGIRTFALLALVGTLATEAGAGVVAVALAGVVALLVVGYRRTSRADPGTTTEVAAMATFLLGVLSYHDSALAAALAIGIVALLMSKDRLHRFVSDVLSDVEMEDALKFLVGAFVILPLLPRRGVGPYGILNPSRIWLLVVVLTGISWVGYVAVRTLGARRGLLATGLAGGFVSATASTASMARASKAPATFVAAVAGARIASAATYVELAIIMTVVSPALSARLVLPALAGALSLGLVSLLGVRAAPPDGPAGRPGTGERVVTLTPAIVLAVILTGALLVARWGASAFGSRGAVVAVAAAGLADAHGGSLTAATLFVKGTLGLRVALVAVGAAMTTNTLVKCAVAYVAGGRRFGNRFSTGVLGSHAVFLAGLGVAVALS